MEHLPSTANHKSSHWAAALIAGLATGVAAGLFIRSKKGKELTADAKKMASHLQKQLMRKIESIEHLTKDTYAEVVEDIVAHYAQAKDLAEEELTNLKEYLLGEWEDVQARLQEGKAEDNDR